MSEKWFHNLNSQNKFSCQRQNKICMCVQKHFFFANHGINHAMPIKWGNGTLHSSLCSHESVLAEHHAWLLHCQRRFYLSGLNALAVSGMCTCPRPQPTTTPDRQQKLTWTQPSSRILMGMGRWEHNCIVNAMFHHAWYLSNVDERYEEWRRKTLRHCVVCRLCNANN